MNQGKMFEEDFKRSIPDHTMIFRIPDPVVHTKDGIAFGARVPFDFILFMPPALFCMELKTTENTSVSFAGPNPMVKLHQIEALLKYSKCSCVFPGLLLNFRKTHETFFIPIDNFCTYMATSGRKSINVKDCNEIGVYIPSWVVKTRLHYDLTNLLKYGEKYGKT